MKFGVDDPHTTYLSQNETYKGFPPVVYLPECTMVRTTVSTFSKFNRISYFSVGFIPLVVLSYVHMGFIKLEFIHPNVNIRLETNILIHTIRQSSRCTGKNVFGVVLVRG